MMMMMMMMMVGWLVECLHWQWCMAGGFDCLGGWGPADVARQHWTLSIAASHPILACIRNVCRLVRYAHENTTMKTPPRVKTDKETRLRSLKIAFDDDKIRVRRLENGSRIQKDCTHGSRASTSVFVPHTYIQPMLT
jgi:hypothetical protein